MLAGALATYVLLDWAFRGAPSLPPGGAFEAMTPTAALVVLLLVLAPRLWRPAGLAALLAAAVLALAPVVERLVGLGSTGAADVADAALPTVAGPALTTTGSVCLLLLAAVELAPRRFPPVAAEGLALVVVLLAVASLVGRAWPAGDLDGWGGYEPMAALTAASVLALGVSLFLSVGDRWAAWLAGWDAGPGAMIRHRLLPVLVVLPAAGWLRLRAETVGWYATPTGLTVMVLLSLAVLGAAIWSIAADVERADRRRRVSLHSLATINDDLEHRLRSTSRMLEQERSRRAALADRHRATADVHATVVAALDAAAVELTDSRRTAASSAPGAATGNDGPGPDAALVALRSSIQALRRLDGGDALAPRAEAEATDQQDMVSEQRVPLPRRRRPG